MKKKILMKHILAALTMAAMVPIGQTWAAVEISGSPEDSNYTVKLNGNDYNSYWQNGQIPTITDGNGELHKITDFNNVIINKNSTSERNFGLDLCTLQKTDGNVSHMNFNITMTGSGENSDALHLRNWENYFQVNNFTADVSTVNSDAINIGSESTSSTVEIHGDLNATVADGNGIRANSQLTKSNTEQISQIIVHGNTTINLKGGSVTNEKYIGGLQTVKGTYNPAAVYAGNDSYNCHIQINTWFGNYEKDLGSSSVGHGVINLMGKTTINIGNDNYGLYAGKNGQISIGDDLKLTANGDNSIGIAAENSNLIFKDHLHLSGLINQDINQELDTSENTYGSKVTLNGDTNVITMTGDNSYAIYAEGVDASGESNTVQSGDNGIGSFEITGDIAAENGGLIDLHATGAESYLTGDVKAYGTENGSGATVKLSVDQALAGMGTIAAANGGTVTLSLGTGSSWSGRADDYQDAVNEEWNGTHESNFENPFSGNITSNGTVNVTLADGAVWNVTGQSWVTNLEGNNSTIMLCGDALHEGDGIVSDGTGGYALHVENLKGTNTFIMNVRPTEAGDMLYVKNGNNYTQNLIINNRDEVLTHMNVNDAVRFATVANPGGGFESGSISDGSAAATFGRQTRINDEGMFNVDFAIKYSNYGEELTDDGLTDLGNEESYNGSKATADKPSSDYVENVYNEDGAQNVYLVRKANTLSNLSHAGQTVIDMSKVNYSNAVYMDRLNKRMGEARYLDGDDGLWVRLRHDRIGKEDAFRSMNTMMELGYDWKAKGQKDGEHRQGVVFDYMRGTADYTNVMGDGDIRRAGVWLYDTWLGDKGHYTDYVVKYGHLSNDFDIYAPTTLEEINGDYSNDVWSVSAEYGRKKDIGNDWYIEPQAQMQYAYVTSADYTTSQGTKVELDGIDSLIGRAGFRLGRDTSEGNTVYFKADILHEFLGDQSIRAMDSTGVLSTTYENEGTWYDVGFGFSHRMGKDSYMFLDLEHSFGNDNADTWQINVGLNWKV